MRTELISLMNLLHKLSESLIFYDYFLSYEQSVVVPQYLFFKRLMSLVTFIIAFFVAQVAVTRGGRYLRKRKLSGKLD